MESMVARESFRKSLSSEGLLLSRKSCTDSLLTTTSPSEEAVMDRFFSIASRIEAGVLGTYAAEAIVIWDMGYSLLGDELFKFPVRGVLGGMEDPDGYIVILSDTEGFCFEHFYICAIQVSDVYVGDPVFYFRGRRHTISFL